ncbi:MAG: hypothetical protein ACTSU5_11830, partial [Promethearchaeota archaeon]
MQKRKSYILAFFVTALMFAALVPQGTMAASLSSVAGPSGSTVKYGMDVYNVSQEMSWNNDVVTEFSDSGSYSDSYSYTYEYMEWNDTVGDYVWVVEDTSVSESTTYDMYMKMTATGHMKTETKMDVYTVQLTQGANLQFYWFACKNGTFTLGYEIKDMSQQFNESYTSEIQETRTYKYYDLTTNALLGQRTETQTYTDSEDFDYSDADYDSHMNMTINESVSFVGPIFLTMQVFRTPNNDVVAWADSFNEMIMYNDTDGDKIYSVGDKQGGSGGTAPDFNLYYSDEYAGSLMPMAYWGEMTMKMGYSYDDPFMGKQYVNMDQDMSISTPSDKTAAEVMANLNFTEPVVSGDTVTWGLDYNNLPANGMTENSSATYTPPDKPTLAQSSPADFKYKFAYKINNSAKAANLFTTVDIPRITNDSLFRDVQGLSLCIPHSVYFMASKPVTQQVKTPKAKPNGQWGFDIGSLAIAAINMTIPGKENYTLFDYPKAGENEVYASLGGTVSAIIANSQSESLSMSSMGNPFSRMIFTLEDYVVGKGSLSNYTTLYSVVTQNYPVWSGHRIL